jgi:hypothetical protein
VFNGVEYRNNERPDGTDVAQYLAKQRRYGAMDANAVRGRIAAQWRWLDRMAR